MPIVDGLVNNQKYVYFVDHPFFQQSIRPISIDKSRIRTWQGSCDGIGSQMPEVLLEQGGMTIPFRRNCNIATAVRFQFIASSYCKVTTCVWIRKTNFALLFTIKKVSMAPSNRPSLRFQALLKKGCIQISRTIEIIFLD